MNKAVSGIQQLIGDRQHNRLLRLSFPNDDGPRAPLLVNRIGNLQASCRLNAVFTLLFCMPVSSPFR